MEGAVSGPPWASEGTFLGPPTSAIAAAFLALACCFDLSRSYRYSVRLSAVTKRTTSCHSSFTYHHITTKPYLAAQHNVFPVKDVHYFVFLHNLSLVLHW